MFLARNPPRFDAVASSIERITAYTFGIYDAPRGIYAPHMYPFILKPCFRHNFSQRVGVFKCSIPTDEYRRDTIPGNGAFCHSVL